MGINIFKNCINMKFLVVLCIAFAVAAASTQNTCQVERDIAAKLAKDISARTQVQTRSVAGECSDGEGFACIGEILGTVMSCIGAVGLNPIAVFGCVTGIISAASDCYDCICWVMSYAGVTCP